MDVEHQGTYWCHVFNDREDQDSEKIEVIIGKEFFCLILVSRFINFFLSIEFINSIKPST